MIYIFEITYPGSRLVGLDRDWAWKAEQAIRELETPVVDAALALSMFEAEQNRPFPSHDSEKWQRDAERRQHLEAEISQQLGVDRYDWDSYERIRTAADLISKREKWAAGQLPRSYEGRFVFIHARSYLLALDRFDRSLQAFAEMDDVPDTVKKAPERLESILANLRAVRNSVAHHEDRSRGLLRPGKHLDLKPIDNQLINAPHGGVLVLEGLMNNRFGSVMADGHYGEVEISPTVLGQVRDLLQDVINSFDWDGPPRHEPY